MGGLNDRFFYFKKYHSKPIFDDLHSYVKVNHSDLTLIKIAKETGISESTLYKEFRKIKNGIPLNCN